MSYFWDESDERGRGGLVMGSGEWTYHQERRGGSNIVFLKG